MKKIIPALVVSVIAFVGCGQEDAQSTVEQDTVQLALDGTVPSAGSRGGPHGRGHGGPPPEAVAACTGKAADAACSFVHRDRTLDGACKALPDNATMLVCRPFPPAELVAACTGLAADAACTVTRPDGGTATGTCRAPRFDAAPLLCAPAGGPAGGPGRGGHHAEGGGQCHHGGADGGTTRTP